MTTPSSSPTPDRPPHPQQGSAGGPPRYVPAPGQDGPGGAVPAPPEHRRLLSLTLASAALYVLNAIVSLIASATADLTGAYERLGLPADQARAMADEAGGSSTAMSLLVLVVALGLYALVYTGLKKGRNWARILGTVLAVISVLGTVVGFFGSLLFGGWAVVLIALGVAVLVVDILWLVTAFRKPVSSWFAQQSHLR